MSEQIGLVLEAIRLDRETNRSDHDAFLARLEALEGTNRAEHEELRGEMRRLGVEFEQHRHDTKALADGILGLAQKTKALQLTDAALDCRVTKLEIRVSGLAPRTRKRK